MPRRRLTAEESDVRPSGVVLRRDDEGVTTLILNRPQRLNALSDDLLTELTKQLRSVDEEVRAVVLKGHGPAFCSGYDLIDAAARGGGRSEEQIRAGVERTQAVTTGLRSCPAPVIAVVHGYAIGGGAEIALACDLVIAAEETVFQFPETALGLSPTNGSSHLLPAAVGPFVAKELMLLGERFSAERANRLGLVNRVVPGDLLEVEVNKVTADLCARPPHAVRATKALLDRGADGGLEGALQAETVTATRIEADGAADGAIRAFGERRG